MGLNQPNHSGCAGKSGRLGTLPAHGLDSKPMTVGRATDPDDPAANVDGPRRAGGGETQHGVDGRRGGAGVVAECRDASTQPAPQDGRREAGIDDTVNRNEGLDQVVVFAQQAGMAGKGSLDLGAGVAKNLQHPAPQSRPRVAAGDVVFVDHSIIDAEAQQGIAEGRLVEREERPDARDAIDDLDCSRRPAPAAASLPGKVKQHAFGDVAAVMGVDDSANGEGHSDGAEGLVAGGPQAGLVRLEAGERDDPTFKAKSGSASDDGGSLRAGSDPQAMVNGDDLDAPGTTAPAGNGLEQGAGVGASRDRKNDAIRAGIGDGVEGIPEWLQGPPRTGVEVAAHRDHQGATNGDRPNSASRAAIVCGEAAQYFFTNVEGLPLSSRQSQGKPSPLPSASH